MTKNCSEIFKIPFYIWNIKKQNWTIEIYFLKKKKTLSKQFAIFKTLIPY